MTWEKWAAALLSVLVLLGGAVLVFGYDSVPTTRCLVGEGVPSASVDIGPSWWPPGTRCTYHHRDGSTTSAVKAADTPTLVVIAGLLLLAIIGPFVVGAVWRRWYARVASLS